MANEIMWCDSLNKSVSKEPLGEPSSKKGKAKATNNEGNKVVGKLTIWAK